ncbi:MAG: hypothetical protein LCH26_02130 [Proteobacteria bacterium]|nr:hypothetical protein [Pseudomonadota bacterium]
MRILTLFAIGLACLSSQLKAETFVACPATSSIKCEGPRTHEMHPGLNFWDCEAGGWKTTVISAENPMFEGEPAPMLDGHENPACFYKHSSEYKSFLNAQVIERVGTHGKCKVNKEKAGFDCPGE